MRRSTLAEPRSKATSRASPSAATKARTDAGLASPARAAPAASTASRRPAAIGVRRRKATGGSVRTLVAPLPVFTRSADLLHAAFKYGVETADATPTLPRCGSGSAIEVGRQRAAITYRAMQEKHGG